MIFFVVDRSCESVTVKEGLMMEDKNYLVSVQIFQFEMLFKELELFSNALL